MVTVPAWITNILFLMTCYLSGFQHVRLKQVNPVMNVQFFMISFSLLMVLIVAFFNRENPWLSVVFLVIALASLGFMIRQLRMLPPTQRFE